MKFALDPLEQGYTIQAYTSEWIQIDEKKYHQSLLLMPAQILQPWAITAVDQITTETLAELAEFKPQILLIGTGKTQQFLPAKVFAPLISLGIGYEMMATGAACRTYDILLSEGRRVLAALIL